MKRHKLIKIFICLFLLCIYSCLYGCEKDCSELSKESSQDGKKDDGQFVVGFSMATLKEDRWLKDKELLVALAQKRGIDVIVKNALNDSKEQYNQVRELIHSGIDILVIVPTDMNSDNTKECVRLAIDSGVHVIYYDKFIKNAGTQGCDTVYVGFDNELAGKFVGNCIADKKPKGRYLFINGPENDYSSVLFKEGYMSVLQPLIDNGNITPIGEFWTKDWTKEEAANYVKDIMRNSNLGIDGLICANDAMADAIIQVLSILRVNMDDLFIVSQDADITACRRIVKDKQEMTIYKPVEKMVETVLDVCEKLYNKQKITNPNGGFINDGTFDIPFVKVDVTPVNKNNIDDTVIKDCFHLRNSVYEN